MSAPLLSVVVATYEWPDALDVVLRALSEQSDPAFEVLVADDGSGLETADVVDENQRRFERGLRHVWQLDLGYRRTRILNLAALEARGSYLVFIDGDCLPRSGFLEAIRRAALPDRFLAGKRVHLSPGLSRRVLEDQLPVWRWSAARWLVGHPREFFKAPREVNRAGSLVPLRDRRRPWRQGQPEFSPPYDGYGFLFGVSRSDLELVNGFDTRFVGWGGEDRDIAVRLRRNGLCCGWPGPRATMLHLWHETAAPKSRPNAPLLHETQRSHRVHAVAGMRQLAQEVEGQEARVGSRR